jgi:hypothetical protein
MALSISLAPTKPTLACAIRPDASITTRVGKLCAP